MNRIIEININEILADERGCSEMINHACCRSEALQVTGVCSNQSAIFVILESRPVDCPRLFYRLAPLSSPDKDEIAAAISSRYYSGFSTLGSFAVENQLWGLFARTSAEQ
ncbi:MAG: hypothetical protein WC071_04625 [Victivallaceae bacterium]